MNLPCLTVADIELPRELERLYELAYNFWWSWNPRARRLFSSIDPVPWSQYRNPVQMLINVEPHRWTELLQSDVFLASYEATIKEYEKYVDRDRSTWFTQEHPGYEGGPFAYFCMEFGLHECFNIYSGGLGVLAGDHCKSASDLGLPFVGVGLLYRRGYFRQAIDADGRQQHHYPRYDFTRLPVRPVAGATGKEVVVPIELPGRTVYAKVWLAHVGRVQLILLDTDIDKNDPADRPITGTLYVRGREMRLTQELVLGVGGVRALRALNIQPSVWHLNEGHSAFLQFERLRERRHPDDHRSIEDRLADLRPNTVFTTHTPVPAGNEQFEAHMVRHYMDDWAEPLGAPVDDLMALGRGLGQGAEHSFNLTALALRGSSLSNAVSKLHAEVSNDMWRDLLEPRGETVRAITNGIHTATWVGAAIRELFLRSLGFDWDQKLLEPDAFRAFGNISDEEFWQAHSTQKEQLARFVRRTLLDQFARHGQAPSALRRITGQYRDDVLTIGFARRFATYKRASLIFSDLERLKRLVCNEDRPVQIVFSGKAHPADMPGQELIQNIFKLSRDEALRGKVVFLEDYDMRTGRMLVQGVDVWLNTPRRPMEASGTSGQKAAANGALNLSVLDGWWPEAYREDVGWAIDAGEHTDDHDAQDHQDATALYELLETQVVPLYYDRDESGLAREWIRRMKECVMSITPLFSTSRMVRDYAQQSYLPAAAAADGSSAVAPTGQHQ